MPITIEFIGGPRDGERLAVPGDQATVGREDDCQVHFGRDTTVSRRHVGITWEGSQYFIEDLNSRHGTFVDGEKMTGPMRQVLAIGQVVRVGGSRLAVVNDER